MSSPMQKSIYLFIYYIYMAPFWPNLAQCARATQRLAGCSLAGLFDHQDAQTWSIERMGEGYQVAVRGSED